MFRKKEALIAILFVLLPALLPGQTPVEHPCLLLTGEDVCRIRSELGKVPLLDKTLARLKQRIDAEMPEKMDVPLPLDPAGGYTHEKHKQNYLSMQGAGILWQITREEKYAGYVKEMLLEYAEMYPGLGLHPVDKSYAPGKLFWQSLNEAVWLVYTSQAYDCIYDYLSFAERDIIENRLLVPFADFLSLESPELFNQIHNHGVWAVAAVGMAGFAMEREDIFNRAFTGVPPYTNKSGVAPGFLSQINELFSPDGYYTEGPYYQRYALLPYLLFAQAIENNIPSLRIFEYRDNILQKAVLSVLQMTSSEGKFFPLNDAMKDMSYLAPELIAGLDIVYNQDTANTGLLGIAEEQDEVIISGAGLRVARDIAAGKARPFEWKSLELSDGRDGDEGGTGILRSPGTGKGQTLVMKYPSHGLGHGHFDRLSIIYYDDGNEILQDYGAARFVNVFYKQGGRYLPENDSWAKQTIAHNTVVVDSVSHFRGDAKMAGNFHADKWIFDIEHPGIQVMSAKENNACPGVCLHRTIAMINDSALFTQPLILDIFRIESSEIHNYDLPYYYLGQIMYSDIDFKVHQNRRTPLGRENGYQHLWVEAEGRTEDDMLSFVFLNKHRFYTINSVSDKNTRVCLTRTGANDPEFNLRNEPCFMLRQNGSRDHLFVSAIESHGKNDPVTELTDNLRSSVKNIKTLFNNADYTVIEIQTVKNCVLRFAVANSNNAPDAEHEIVIDGEVYKWRGACNLKKIKNKQI